MRPSCTSFSRLIRATSRRTGSKQLTTTRPGVSSMITSTPVAFSKLLMFRPSRPITRPLSASSVMATLLVVCSLVCSLAYFWMAATMICRLLSRASSWATSTLRRMISPTSCLHSSSTRRRSSSRAWSGDTPASCSNRSRCSARTAVSCASCAGHLLLPAAQLAVLLLQQPLLDRQRVQLAVDRLLLLGHPRRLLGHLPAVAVQLSVELLAGLELLGLGGQGDLLGPRLRLPPGGLPQGVGVGPGAGHHLLPAEGQEGVQPDRPQDGGGDRDEDVKHAVRPSSTRRPPPRGVRSSRHEPTTGADRAGPVVDRPAAPAHRRNRAAGSDGEPKVGGARAGTTAQRRPTGAGHASGPGVRQVATGGRPPAGGPPAAGVPWATNAQGAERYPRPARRPATAAARPPTPSPPPRVDGSEECHDHSSAPPGRRHGPTGATGKASESCSAAGIRYRPPPWTKPFAGNARRAVRSEQIVSRKLTAAGRD